MSYRVYYGTASRVYTKSVEVLAPTTTATIKDLLDGQSYFFAVKAVNSLGVTSPNSSELAYGTTSVPLSTNVSPTLSAISNVALKQNVTKSVSLSGITSGSTGEVQTLTVTATSSNPTLIANPTVTYTSPNTTGQLLIPAAKAAGTATITVKVSDGQSVNSSATRTFTVTVNNPPTLSAISNVTVKKSASAQTVLLSGITSGAANEAQPLTVTASSSNTGLIPTPTVFYTSPQSTGFLLFTPVPRLTGTATITVTVKDGQTVNNYYKRSFTVTVSSTGTALPTAGALTTVSSVVRQSGRASDSEADPVVLLTDKSDKDESSGPGDGQDHTTAHGQAPGAPNEDDSPDFATSETSSDESELEDTNAIQISNLVVASSDARHLELAWDTDLPTTCIVNYGLTAETEWTTASSSFGYSHEASLANLQPGATYFVRVIAAPGKSYMTASELATVDTPSVSVLSWPVGEAELAETMYLSGDDEVADTEYITTSEPDFGVAMFNVEFPEGMRYRVWARVQSPTGDGSFRISIDGGPETLAYVRDDGSGRWRWVQLETPGGDMAFLSNGGSHLITVLGVIPDLKLSELCISNDPEWSPPAISSAPRLWASRGNGSSINLRWTDWSNADHYVIESSVGEGEFFPLVSVDPTARSFQVWQSDTWNCQYRITAFQGDERIASSDPVSVSEPIVDSPVAPEILSAEIMANFDVVLEWSHSGSNVTGFILERSMDGLHFDAVKVLSSDSTYFIDTVAGLGTFFYRLRAVNEGVESSPSEVRSVSL